MCNKDISVMKKMHEQFYAKRWSEMSIQRSKQPIYKSDGSEENIQTEKWNERMENTEQNMKDI